MMKIVVLIPAADFHGSAGARIRYGRIGAALAEHGWRLTLQDIALFDANAGTANVVLVGKCYDARSLVAAELAARRGAVVGVDLFDDYFSQTAESGLGRFRTWLRQMLSIASFATCSTRVLADVVQAYRPGLPIHVVNDPAPETNYEDLPGLLARKRAEATADRRLRLCWFGVGDNPHFTVGLSDIAAFADRLKRLASGSFSVQLSILTNSRALNQHGLTSIAGLPLPTSVAEWSQKAEAEVLRESFACFLPVNAQQFGTAKSLNRAITALCAGCQVLSVGNPIYKPLDRLIYRDPDQLLDDLSRERLRLGIHSVEELRSTVSNVASPSNEAASLANFLAGLLKAPRAPAPRSEPLVLVHGAATSATAHALVQSAGGLSIGTPFCTVPLEFDAMFTARAGSAPVLIVSRRALSRVAPALRRSAKRIGRIGRRKFWQLGDDSGEATFDWTEPQLALQIALYEPMMRSIFDQLDTAFGSGRKILSENSSLPFELAAQ